MVLEIDGADHPECGVPASSVVDYFNPVSNGLAFGIAGHPALTVVEFSFKRRPDFNFNNESISLDDQRDFAAKAVKRAVKRHEGEVQELREQAIASAKLATTLAELMDTLSGDTEEGWCSRCLTKSTYRKSKSKSLYVCENCGSATSHCTVPQCDNFAAAGLGLVALPTVCAEHLHQVPDFERLDHRIADLTQWRELREFKAANVGRAAKLAAVGAGALVLGVAGGWVAAPMVGSAYGTTVLAFLALLPTMLV